MNIRALNAFISEGSLNLIDVFLRNHRVAKSRVKKHLGRLDGNRLTLFKLESRNRHFPGIIENLNPIHIFFGRIFFGKVFEAVPT